MSAIECWNCSGIGESHGARLYCGSCYDKQRKEASEQYAIDNSKWLELMSEKEAELAEWRNRLPELIAVAELAVSEFDYTNRPSAYRPLLAWLREKEAPDNGE